MQVTDFSIFLLLWMLNFTIGAARSPRPATLATPMILTLPLEVVEDILVFLAESPSPASVSHLAQSCRHFRQIIYDPLDKFLWRRVFLTTFDDPRPHDADNAHSEFVFAVVSLKGISDVLL